MGLRELLLQTLLDDHDSTAQGARQRQYSNPLNSTPALPYNEFDAIREDGVPMASMGTSAQRGDMDQVYREKIAEAGAAAHAQHVQALTKQYTGNDSRMAPIEHQVSPYSTTPLDHSQFSYASLARKLLSENGKGLK